MDKPNECCNDERNLELISIVANADGSQTMITRQCKVCNCKHYEISVPPIEVGIKDI